VQERDDAVRGISAELVEKSGVDIGLDDIELRSGGPKCLGDTTSRAQ
jgi:hypothetical protein